MPSAANVKIEKQIASDNALADPATASPPIRQAITVIEHKIRNLEKRKSKLESYRELQRSGKDLNQDQKTAVAKYDEVVQTLDFARDVSKQLLGIAVSSEKEEKKRLRKEVLARSQGELTKIREVLLVQDALTCMGQETIRDDFLNGRNGAAQLSQNDLKLLDDLYAVVSPKHEAGDPTSFMPQVQAAAEHLLAVVDGKQKEIFGANYSQIKEVIGKIHESGYLDQAVDTYVEEVAPVDQVEISEGIDQIPNQAMENMNYEEMPPMQPLVVGKLVEVPILPPPMDAPVAIQPPVPEQMYYQPPPPQQRPISEVIGTGSFFFLQESELDTPPEQIPTQTFTNQTFVGGPPPPIPMPPHFTPYPQCAPQQQPQVIPTQQPLVQQPVILSSQTNNGLGDHIPENQDEINRQRGNRHQPNQRPNAAHQPQFFSNNNGYSRPNNRNRNNGPRPNTNRHN